MSEEAGFLLVDVLKGYHPLSTAFWLSLFMIIGLYAYEFFAPSFSDFWDPYIRGLHLLVFTYAVVAIHHSCVNARFIVRMLARAYVLLLIAFCTYAAVFFYGKAGLAYPLAAWAAVFLVKEK